MAVAAAVGKAAWIAAALLSHTACSIATKPVDERRVQPKAVDATAIVDVQDECMATLIIVKAMFILWIGPPLCNA